MSRRPLIALLGAAFLVTLWMTLSYAVPAYGAARTTTVWTGYRSLSLDLTDDRLAALDETTRDVARAGIDAENRAIAWGVAAGMLLCLCCAVVGGRPVSLALLVLVSVALVGVVNRVENGALQMALDGAADGGASLVAARTAAIGKLVLMLIAGAGLLALAGAALRIATAEPVPQVSTEPMTFEQLVQKETDGIFKGLADRIADRPNVVPHHAADEPRVWFREADITGLALSGGGIRSATFNLGLLQGLHRRSLLQMFDYVATVSGGGYVGAFWSAALKRAVDTERVRAASAAQAGQGAQTQPVPLFPSRWGEGPDAHVDSSAERHLREFSGFLAPRWGFFEVETWTAIVAILSGLVPALAVGVAIIGLVLMAWLALTLPLALSPLAPIVVIAVVTFATMCLFEWLWYEVKSESSGGIRHQPGRWWFWVFAVPAIGLTALVQRWLPDFYHWWAPAVASGPGDEGPLLMHWALQKLQMSGLPGWWLVAGIHRLEPQSHVVSPRLFDYAVSWGMVALLMLVVRLAQPLGIVRFGRDAIAAYDRVVMRLLGAATSWAVFAILWHIVINSDRIAALVTGAGASSALFAALRNWIGVTLRKATGAGVLTRLKPLLPQLLAYLTVVLLAIAVGRLLIVVGDTDLLAWCNTAAVLTVIACIGLFIDPAQFGLHAFYRERLNRAFTGASNIAAGHGARDNRDTDPRSDDDCELSTLVPRPLHLICCAANDLSGDTVETLGRGARSAVLSTYGFAMGDRAAPTPHLQLGSAITASAAAFNSNMGMISMRVGPAVSFLMTALNLRLGLWVRHPDAGAESTRRWPGLLLYREMFGLTSSSGTITNVVPPFMRDIHLSDGAHFENLALYELVRRHCRYILLSDCGADPSVAFDDLGNALRRIREDFGVDISLDVAALRPSETARRSKQHVVIGTIHYSSTDRGILLYVKPSLTGDEPPDVLQYETRNSAFPHETTGDQFYDEAQYESYRRLGLHAAEEIFAFVPPNPAAQPGSGATAADADAPQTPRPITADWVFAEAMHRWGPTPAGLVDNILAMTARFGQIEMDLQRQERTDILSEVFPELAFLPSLPPATELPVDLFPELGFVSSTQPAAAAKPTSERARATDAKDLPFFIRATQVMEDAWMACQLDDWWDHPLNLGWVNLFARWATAPSFAFWWPILSPMYSPGFRDFINERFAVRALATKGEAFPVNIPQRGRVALLETTEPKGLAQTWWQTRSTQPCRLNGTGPSPDRRYQYLIKLPDGGQGVELQVGLALLTTTEHPRAAPKQDAGWTSNDFFVPPSLWGAGFGWYFLDMLLKEIYSTPYEDCYVVVKGVPHDAQHKIALDDHRSFIEQYRKIGFRQMNARTRDASINRGLLEKLGFKESEDTLFRTNLARWKKRRGND